MCLLILVNKSFSVERIVKYTAGCLMFEAALLLARQRKVVHSGQAARFMVLTVSVTRFGENSPLGLLF